MRYAIIADIHANLTAFNAILEDIETQGAVDKFWCLGDVVGYGPDPHECIELLRQTNHVCVAGNHDWAAIGKISTAYFNPDAAEATQWTADQLSTSDSRYLEKLPLVIEEEEFTLVHGSPREPIWEYIISVGIARENFTRFTSRYCLAGHSHIPQVFILDEDGNCSVNAFSENIKLVPGRNRLIINPGGVGQPRDGDPRASYAIYDNEANTVMLRRVPYDIKATQDRMVKHGLPMRLVARLDYGM